MISPVKEFSSAARSAQETAAPPPSVPEKLAADHLPNAYRLHERGEAREMRS